MSEKNDNSPQDFAITNVPKKEESDKIQTKSMD